MDILYLLSTKKNISGEEIARTLNISRAAVHKKIIRLRKQGYRIIGHKNIGYSLLFKPDLLLPEEIKYYLNKNNEFGKSILYYSKIDSTQTKAKILANNGEQEGTLIISETQGEGYGRQKRKWFSPRGGIWLSIILKPNIYPEYVPQITLLLSIAVCRAIEYLLDINTKIKWPNDIMLKNKKLGGILTEMSAEVGKTNWIVTGLGLNANNKILYSLESKAVSLYDILKKKINRAQLVGEIINIFYKMYKDYCKNGFSKFKKEYNGLSYIISKKIKIIDTDRTLSGTAQEVDDDGYLWLKLDNGDEFKIISGEVIKT